MAETYKPTEAMANAAKRALKWREEGKANGAGTAVGWTRANQLAKRQALSLDTVKRMYSFFSRHEVDKKGKGFYSGPEFPSNGRIMWDAWGGDSGFSWSRKIVNSENKKTESKADSISVGSMVSWKSSGGMAQGKVVRIVRNGSIDVPDSDFTIEGTEENPAVLIRLYRDGKPTDTYVGHRYNTLNRISSKAEGLDDEDEYPEDEYSAMSERELLLEDFMKNFVSDKSFRRIVDIEKSEEVSEISVDSPAQGVDESFSDVPAGEITEQSEVQDAASQGGLSEQQREDSPEDENAMGGDAPEGEQPEVSESSQDVEEVVEEVEEDKSFWSGFFGAPKIPRVE